ncbi:hypothetical protein HMPREF1985_00166 [Mitsuokella sp. oral taxon 131 str. W9106]|nr:hypothetical protein HMPREF1985_00166 [Mitsuokella sp. oral taxon 131 str. W9106]
MMSSSRLSIMNRIDIIAQNENPNRWVQSFCWKLLRTFVL